MKRRIQVGLIALAMLGSLGFGVAGSGIAPASAHSWYWYHHHRRHHHHHWHHW